MPVIGLLFAWVSIAKSDTLFGGQRHCPNYDHSATWAGNTRSWFQWKIWSKITPKRQSFCRLCFFGIQRQRRKTARRCGLWPRCSHWAPQNNPWCFWSSFGGFVGGDSCRTGKFTSRRPDTARNCFGSVGFLLALFAGNMIVCSSRLLKSRTRAVWSASPFDFWFLADWLDYFGAAYCKFCLGELALTWGTRVWFGWAGRFTCHRFAGTGFAPQ